MGGNKYIGVDLGGTNLRVALIQGSKILSYTKKKTPQTKKGLLRELEETIKYTADKEKNIQGIGIASPGPLLDGVIKNTPNIALKNFNLEGFLKKRFKIKVKIENDANCVALSESRFGYKKQNMVILTLGTGIGGGLVINGGLYTGGGYAAEPGHMIIDDGKDFETLWQENRAKSRKYFGEKALISDLVNMNTKKSKELLDELTECMGKGIANLINILDPEIVILMGGLRESGTKFLSLVRKKVAKYQIIPRKVPVQWSKLKHPGVLGASLLVR